MWLSPFKKFRHLRTEPTSVGDAGSKRRCIQTQAGYIEFGDTRVMMLAATRVSIRHGRECSADLEFFSRFSFPPSLPRPLRAASLGGRLLDRSLFHERLK